MRYSTKWPTYAKEWDAMVIKPSRIHQFTVEAQFAITNKARYQAIEAKTGVNWYHIAVIHRRESNGNFHTYLGNGDALDRPTHDVPRHRGPFPTFEAGAIDALRLDGLTSVHDWTIEKILYYCELFNGAGYDAHNLPSPYLWGGTNIEKPGKYIRDGVWNSHVVDTQPGCAPLLASIAKLDPTVTFTRETAPQIAAAA